MWNSLTPDFQLELLAEEDDFKRGEEYDGLLLWNKLVLQVNPSTKISVGNLKDELIGADLKNFNQDVKKFNTWFTEKRNLIVREVGKEWYTEYKQCLFKTYRTAENEEFLTAVNAERRDWMMGKQEKGYNYASIQSFALKMFNNQVALGVWKLTKGKVTKTEPKFLALLTEIQELKKSISKYNLNPDESRNERGYKKEAHNSWKYQNTEGNKTMTKENRTYKWCTKDCHKRPMWCGMKNCLSRE